MVSLNDPRAEDVTDVSGSPGLPEVQDRSIGGIIAELRQLSVEQVERVLDHQRQSGLRFGEAAVALGLVTQQDVVYALSQQFHYPTAPHGGASLTADLVALNEPFGPRAEHFRALRTQVAMRLFAAREDRPALAVVSPERGDGKTYCAVNLATVLAQLGERTLLIDADMRAPRVHEVFKLDGSRGGLSSILAGRADENVIQSVPGVPSLFLLPVGTVPPNPLELIERPAFGLLMRELRSKFDYVIVDTPAGVLGADATVIAARCGAALVVARHGASRIGMLQDLVGDLEGSAVRIGGVVLNEH